MSLASRFRTSRRRALRAGVVAGLAGVLSACAAHPPPGTLPGPEDSPDPDEIAPDATHWTILLHAGEDPGKAEEQASIARERFDRPISVLGGGGEYRVEVGDFAREDDARAFLGVVRERGFPGASVRPLESIPAQPATTPGR